MTRRHSGTRLALATTVGYLAGTAPSADIATRLARTGTDDLRADGGNPGALNAARQLGPKWGVVVLIADAGKGVVAGMIGQAIAGPNGAYAAATASIAGHIAPVWNGFRGGKGVATSAGACLAVFPAYFPFDAAVAAAGAVGTRNPETSVRISGAAWSAAALLWWWRGWPNAWGPRTTVGLPLFAVAGSAMILAKFAASRRHR